MANSIRDFVRFTRFTLPVFLPIFLADFLHDFLADFLHDFLPTV